MLVFQHTYTLTMLRTHQALILIAVMFWQALSWVTLFVVAKQSQRLARNNLTRTDKAKQTLFIFFSRSDNFIAANFTGQ